MASTPIPFSAIRAVTVISIHAYERQRKAACATSLNVYERLWMAPRAAAEINCKCMMRMHRQRINH